MAMALLGGLATPLIQPRKVGGGTKYPPKVSFGGMLFPCKKNFVGGMLVLVPVEKKFVGLQVECKRKPRGAGRDGPYMCGECDERFKTEGGYKNHWNTKHAEIVANKFWCRKCTHYFINSERLKNHQCLTPIERALRDDARIREEEEENMKKKEENKKKKEEMAAAAIAAAEMKSLAPEEKTPPTAEEEAPPATEEETPPASDEKAPPVEETEKKNTQRVSSNEFAGTADLILSFCFSNCMFLEFTTSLVYDSFSTDQVAMMIKILASLLNESFGIKLLR
ncbi:zinc finger protein [Striga asiatica]|uniref:Zinc finger protein n=1 Tax=Striga asiatica TaxID=4170 RepID=A0A5A7QVI3_STRAF|nr:zinc finger protein [Striga asiatica]